MAIKIRGNKVIEDDRTWNYDLIPSTQTWDLGSQASKWQTLWVGGQANVTWDVNISNGDLDIAQGNADVAGYINTSDSYKIDGSHQTLTIGEGPGSESVTFDGTVNKTMPSPSPTAKNIEYFGQGTYGNGTFDTSWREFDLTNANMILIDVFAHGLVRSSSRWGRSDSSGNLQVNGAYWTGWNVGYVYPQPDPPLESWGNDALDGNSKTWGPGGDYEYGTSNNNCKLCYSHTNNNAGIGWSASVSLLDTNTLRIGFAVESTQAVVMAF